MSNKKYGLILPDKGKQLHPAFQASRNVFGNDSDSEEESIRKPILLRPSDNINRQARLTQEKAVKEDPTVYQYDEIYDEVTSKKEKEKIKNKEEKKPRYIENLMKTANKRKIENERRIERQIQKERENEGDEFRDKEVFVTSAYKKKLEELALEEEREKREEYLESIGDVTKQKDLGGFYRHLYEQKLGNNKNVVNNDENTSGLASKENIESTLNDKSETEQVSETKKRNYRKRKSSDHQNHLSDGEIEDSDEEINRVNLEDIRMAKKNKYENIDADSDFSIDESSDDDTQQKDGEKTNQDTPQQIFKKPDTPDMDNKTEKIEKNLDLIQNMENLTEEPKQKIDIWKKRTVDEVFEQALKRYYERKASRA